MSFVAAMFIFFVRGFLESCLILLSDWGSSMGVREPGGGEEFGVEVCGGDDDGVWGAPEYFDCGAEDFAVFDEENFVAAVEVIAVDDYDVAEGVGGDAGYDGLVDADGGIPGAAAEGVLDVGNEEELAGGLV